MDLYHSKFDSDALAHRAVLRLAARGVEVSPLAVAGAALEIREEQQQREMLKNLIEGLSK